MPNVCLAFSSPTKLSMFCYLCHSFCESWRRTYCHYTSHKFNVLKISKTGPVIFFFLSKNGDTWMIVGGSI